MKLANRKIPNIYEDEPTINDFISLDSFGPHAALPKGVFRELKNFNIFGEYIKSRWGSRVLANTRATNLDILNYVVFDTGEKEYLIVQQDAVSYTQFQFMELSADGFYDDVVYKSDGTQVQSFPTADEDRVADMMMSNGKVYVFQAAGNMILEWNETQSRFESRKMGLPAPQINSITTNSLGSGTKGTRVYGVELVFKDTSVTPNVDIVVSGPNRAKEVTGTPEFGEGALAIVEGDGISTRIGVSNTLNDGTLITDTENSFWTHVRLYRSLDTTTATNSVPELEGPAEIVGRFDELFLLQEMDRATFLAAWDAGEQAYLFLYDSILDKDIPYPLDVVLGDRMEMYPIPPATTGAFQRNRIWASGITNFPGPSGPVTLDNIESKIFFSPETFTKYSESVRALSAVESDPGDGQRMIKLLPFQEDLIGIKEGKTGRVQRGDPNAGWITEDEVIGIENKRHAQYVPRVGICAIVNDQKDFRIFGYDMRWHSNFAGMQVSRPIRNIVKDWTLEDISFMYMNGKLFLNGGEATMLVLHTEQQKGWSKYTYPLDNLSEVMFTFDEGRRAAIANRNQLPVEIEVEDLETDFDAVTETDVYAEWEIITHKWQDMGGRSLIEHRFLSMVAILQEQISVQPYVNGRIWDDPFGMLLDPADYPDTALQETEYQGYSEIKPLGNYIHYKLTGNKPATIYSIMLNCLIHRGSIAPGFDPFQILDMARRVPNWASIANDYNETGAAAIEIDENGGRTIDIVEGQ